MAKGYVVIDLATLHGPVEYVAGNTLDRANKTALELSLANILLKSLSADEGTTVSEIRPNSNDPPDILFAVDEKPVGMELVELLPENRLERDAILIKVKRGILAQLQVSEQTRDHVVTIMLVNDYASKISLPSCAAALATALDGFFSEVTQEGSSRREIPVPHQLRDHVRLITVDRCDLRRDTRIENRTEPLIVFSAQNTNIIPDRQFPSMVGQVVGRKELHDLTMPTWLLLWSNHSAFGPFRDDLVKHLDQYLIANPSKYARVFYLHLHRFGDITEFLSET